MAVSRVAVLTTSSETVTEDFARLMRLVSYRDILHPDRETILSIDLSWHHFFPGCSTTPWQLDGVIKTLLDEGFQREKIQACFNSTIGISVKKGEVLNRQRIVLEKHGVQIIHLTEKEKRIRYEPRTPMKILGTIFSDGISIPERFIGSSEVYLPTMKTHIHTTIAGALYTAFEGLFGRKRSRAYAGFNDALTDTLAIIREIHPGILAVMDGTFAGEGPGPKRLVPHISNVIAASSDPLALDAVAAHMMGFDPLSIPFIRMAHETGLGTGDIREIEIMGDDVSEMRYHFQVNPSAMDSLLWKLENSFSGGISGSLVSHAVMMYNDWYWYINVGEKIIRPVMKSGWGKLFEKYRK